MQLLLDISSKGTVKYGGIYALLSLMLLTSVSGFCQNAATNKRQVRAYFITDSLGQMGLRETLVTSQSHKNGSRQLFDGTAASDYFKDMTKPQILELLGKPNRTISLEPFVNVGERDEAGNLVYPDTIVDKIEYDIRPPTRSCHNGVGHSLQTINVSNPGYYDKPGNGAYIYFETYYECSEKREKLRQEEIVMMGFSFYPEKK
jgi:hypothetical protein